MKTLEGPLLFAAVLLAGCGTTKNLAVTSYHVTRDVAVGSYRTEPGRPVSSQQVTATPHRRSKLQAESSQSSSRTTPRTDSSETTQAHPKSSSAQASYPQTAFPTAKAVPDKPGYVFSPFDNSGRYVDVSGYASGTKVKDPWTDKIFVVP